MKKQFSVSEITAVASGIQPDQAETGNDAGQIDEIPWSSYGIALELIEQLNRDWEVTSGKNKAAEIRTKCELRRQSCYPSCDDADRLKLLRPCAHGCRLGRRNALILAIGLGLGGGLAALANVDAALEVGAVFNGDAGCDHVAGQ